MNKLLGQIKRFGLDHSDIPAMYWNLTQLFTLLSVNIDSKRKSLPRHWSVVTAIGAAICFYIYVVTVFYLARHCFATGDQVTALVAIASGICNAISYTKLGYIFFYNKELVKIVDDYILGDVTLDSSSRLYRKQRDGLRNVKKRAVFAWMFIIINWVLYILVNLILPGRQPMQEVMHYGVLLLVDNPSEVICLLVEVIASFFVVYVSATVAAFMITLTGCAEAQMIALSIEIHHLCDDGYDDYQNYQNKLEFENRQASEGFKLKFIDQAIKKRLERIIEFHYFNIKQINALEQVFRGAMALEGVLVLSALITTLLGGLENTYPLIPYALILIALDCLAGQKLKDAGIIFETAIYESNWESLGVSNMKTVLLMLRISQKNLNLSAGSMRMLDFRCLLSVLQSIYSAYTALRSTMNKS